MRGVWMVVLAASLVGAGPALAAQEQKVPSQLPAEIVAAWVKAGAQAGWMGDEKFGWLVFRSGGEGKEGEVPAFGFKQWQPGVLSRLPQPERAFGLSLQPERAFGLSLQTVTDAGLKELAGLKSLQALDLSLLRQTLGAAKRPH
jgi:internalin A